VKGLAIRSHAVAWLALMVLLALTAGSSLLPLGIFNAVCNFAIAIVKAAIVLVFFMHVLRGGPSVRIAAAAGLAWIGILVALSLSDFLARGY
jgi:cytochrome c oxidase subunit IV